MTNTEQHNPEGENQPTPEALATAESEAHEVPQTDVHLSRPFIDELIDTMRSGEREPVLAMFEELHAADVADILEVLPSNKRLQLIEYLGDKIDPDVLFEVEGEAQEELYEHLPNDQIADAVTELETDDAVYVIEELEDADREEVMRALASDDRAAIEENLSYPEDPLDA